MTTSAWWRIVQLLLSLRWITEKAGSVCTLYMDIFIWWSLTDMKIDRNRSNLALLDALPKYSPSTLQSLSRHKTPVRSGCWQRPGCWVFVERWRLSQWLLGRRTPGHHCNEANSWKLANEERGLPLYAIWQAQHLWAQCTALCAICEEFRRKNRQIHFRCVVCRLEWGMKITKIPEGTATQDGPFPRSMVM